MQFIFSPHKFLGGPGSSGILIFNKALYSNKIPDNPGGGTVDWTNPWGEHKYVNDIQARERWRHTCIFADYKNSILY